MICDVDAYSTIVDVLRNRSAKQPDKVAYRFLSDDGAGCSEITYRELDEDAQQVGAWIQARGIAGQPVPLIFPSGLDFIRAFLGCQYAGICAVPLSLPAFSEGASRIVAVLNDIKPSIVLVGDAQRERLHRELRKHSEQPAFDLVSFATTQQGKLSWREPAAVPDRLALLQYTSGSTSSPKGVEISHRNLLHNIGQMSIAAQVGADSVGVSWLPHFHDMGLIGGILMPLCIGFPVTLMSPSSFVRRPRRWLETISELKATISGAPNFGYEHCLGQIASDELRSIDLSSWRTAFSGAEAIRADTIERFCARFGSVGFRRDALFPCYGLAEATLMVSGRHWGEFSERDFSRAGLRRGLALEPDGDADRAALVSSGPVLAGHEVQIVDLATRRECGPGAVGEIWVGSASVGRGYWGRPEESADVFRAQLDGRGQGFLRTGDLGFLWRGQMFVTGRQKDLLIMRGANFYPQDIERALESAVPTLRVGFGAVFTVEHECEEKLVVTYELDRVADGGPYAEFDAIVATLARQFGVQVHAIALVKRNKLPRTTSGKIRRQQCKTDFAESRLAIVAEWHNPAGDREAEWDQDWEEPSSDVGEVERVGILLRRQLADLLGRAPATISDRQSIFDLGIDSLLAAQLQNRIEKALDIRLDAAEVLSAGTVGGIVQVLVNQLNDKSRRRSGDLVGDIFEQVSRLSDDEVGRLLSLEESGAVRG